MKTEIFAIYDAAVQAFHQPFFAPTKGAAIRSLTDAVNDAQHQFSKHTKDYTLFTLGSFDDASGTFDTAPPERVLTCMELVNKD